MGKILYQKTILAVLFKLVKSHLIPRRFYVPLVQILLSDMVVLKKATSRQGGSGKVFDRGSRPQIKLHWHLQYQVRG
jgi:hypothetical protein